MVKQHATKTSNKTATSTAILLQAEYNELKRNELMDVLSQPKTQSIERSVAGLLGGDCRKIY